MVHFVVGFSVTARDHKGNDMESVALAKLIRALNNFDSTIQYSYIQDADNGEILDEQTVVED